MDNHIKKFEPAEILRDIPKTISNEPLIGKQEFEAFYTPRINEVRGMNRIQTMKVGLEMSSPENPYKAFLMGHPGVGKSTELTSLIKLIDDKFRAIRFSITKDLDPLAFQPFDILLWMMILISERSASPVTEGGAGARPSDRLLQDIWDWFSVEKDTITKATQLAAEASAGFGVSADSWWGKILGLFARLKGEFKFGQTRKKEKINYRLDRLSRLIQVSNRLVDECNDILKKNAKGRQWLFIGEDFDKDDASNEKVKKFFVSYSRVLKSLRAHMIFTIPIDLNYSDLSEKLPVPHSRRIILPDIPVYQNDDDKSPHKVGRDAITELLKARVSPALFANNQMERLIVASGGNFRDLFTMIEMAAIQAIIRNPKGKIEAPDANVAISRMREIYKSKLGISRFDYTSIPYDKKVDRLLSIYFCKPGHDILDPVLFSLLRSRAVQEFNGKQWFGVHPLVVDILVEQQKLRNPQGGEISGGTV